MDPAQIDNLFLGILQNCGQIEPFLDIIFNFLARRTDFFRIMHKKDDKMGFPEGVAEKMVMKIFKKYQRIVLGSVDVNKEKKASKSNTKTKETTSLDTTKEKQEEQKKQEHEGEEKQKSEPSPEMSVAAPTVVASTVEVTSSDVDQSVNEQPRSSEVQDEKSNTPSKETKPTHETVPSEKSSESESKLLEPGKLPECYNGAVLDKYTWSQTIKDIDIKVPVPKCVQRARDLSVEIKSTSLKVSLKGNIPLEELPSGSNMLVDGELQRAVKCEDSMWSLEPGKCVQINLEKSEERFWTSVCKGDPEIDRTKVDSTRNIDDFDEQTQTDFQQVMYDHQQKQMGKPTSKEKNTHELLEKAWNAKGSPFAGTPFDPSQVNISG